MKGTAFHVKTDASFGFCTRGWEGAK